MEFSEFYRDELLLITNDELRDKIRDILNNDIDQDNFIKGASSTSKYHPKFAQGNQGLVRHTRAMVKILTVFENARPDLNWDDIYSAAILHDCCKYTNGEKYTNMDHADMAYKLILKIANKCDIILRLKLQHIADLVRWHMGRFDFENNIELLKSQVKEDAWILHYADMLCSRKWYGSKDLYIHDVDIKSHNER